MAEENGTSAGAEGTAPTADAGQTLIGNSDGSNLLDWRAGLPENVRSAPIISRHPTMEGAAKSLIAQDEMIGRGIFIPREEPGTDAYNTGMQKIYDKLGRPGKAEEYSFTLPEGRTLDGDMQGQLQRAFHAEGLSQKQADGVMAEYWRIVQHAENVQAGRAQESYAEGRTKLFAEFGANTETVLTKARNFAEHFGAGAFGGKAGELAWEQILEATLADGSRLANSPYLMSVFAEAADRMGEGAFLESSYYQPGQNTLETMQNRARELTAKRHTPGGTSAEEMQELMRLNHSITRAREQAASRGARVA